MKRKLLSTILLVLLAVMGAKAASTGAWRSNYKAATQVYVVTFDEAVSCQYLKIDVTKLGIPANGKEYFLQLAEIEAYEGTTNVAKEGNIIEVKPKP